jgi:hypothetical protein
LTTSFAMAVVVAVLIVVVLYRFLRSRRVVQIAHWKALAHRFRLTLENAGEPHEAALKGDYRGVPVEVTLGSGHTARAMQICTRIFIRHVGAVPPGFAVYPRSVAEVLRVGAPPELSTGSAELDAALCVRGYDEAKTVETLSHERVWGPMAGLFEIADYVRVDERGVLLERAGVVGVELGDLLERGSRFSVDLCEAYEEPYIEFARKHRLSYTGAGTPGDRIIRGYYKGGRVSITMGFDPKTRSTRSSVKAGMPINLPTGFRIDPKGSDEGQWAAIQTHDKQVDLAMVVQGTNQLAIQRMFRDADFKQHILNFVANCPEPRVDGAWVSTGGPGLLCGDIESQVDVVMEVAQAMARAWAPVEEALKRARNPGPRAVN